MIIFFQFVGDGIVNVVSVIVCIGDVYCFVLYVVLLCLYFYIGLFVGFFILVVVLIGMLYVFILQIELYFYVLQLINQSWGEVWLLVEQVKVVQVFLGLQVCLFVVCLVKVQGWNICVMFIQFGLGDLESWVIFVDLVSLQVKGDLIVYGISGVLFLCIMLDYLYCNLMLGDFGCNYSELVVLWLWLGVLGGVWLWW